MHERTEQEIVRRADRCLGLAVRKGQEEGRINKVGDQRSQKARTKVKTSPGSIFDNSYERRDTYAMTDGVSDEQFDKVLDEAKAEQLAFDFDGDLTPDQLAIFA